MIDNGSIDESLAYVKEKFPDVEILALDKNYGYSKGYNFIFKKYINNTEIDYYLILNNDTVLCDSNILNILNNSLKKYGNDNIYSPTILDNNNKIWFGGGKLIKLLGKPIISTSINMHGNDPINDVTQIEIDFPNVDIFEDSDHHLSKGSTIIDFSTSPPNIFRKGDGPYPL